jgi:hypothetical protein
MIGDTDKDDIIMTDEELAYLVDTYTDPNYLFYNLFKRAATIFARQCIKRKLGPISEDATERLKYYKEQSDEYKTKCISGGISQPEYTCEKIFSIGMQSNPPWRPYGI